MAAGIPRSMVQLKIAPDRLHDLPDGAVFHDKSGQASLTVGRDEKGNIVAEASCDSLQRLVLCYEEELARIRSETAEQVSNDVQTELKRPPNIIGTFLIGAAAGLLAGALLTFKQHKR